MSVMAREQAVSPVAAAGSSILIQLITISTGIALALFMGVRAIDQPGLAIVVGAGPRRRQSLSLPFTLPRLASVASALTGRTIEVPPLATGTLSAHGGAIAPVMAGVWSGVSVLRARSTGFCCWRHYIVHRSLCGVLHPRFSSAVRAGRRDRPGERSRCGDGASGTRRPG